MKQKDKHIIFLDTSVFESENFFQGRKLNQLCELSRNGTIELKIANFVYRELLQRIKANIIKSQNAFKKAHNLIDREGKLLKNIKKFQQFYLLPEINIQSIFTKLKSSLDKFLEENSIEIIESKTINVNEIFDNYFSSKPPFGEGKKKNEFPDAFIYSTIKEWTIKNKRKVYLITNDSDFNDLDSKNIDCSNNLSSILDLISRDIDDKHTAFIEELYDESELEIIDSLEKDFQYELSDAVQDKLLQDPFYDDPDLGVPNEIKAEIEIGVINELVLNNRFSYEIESDISFSIDFEYIDLSTGYYDKDDETWYGVERKTTTRNYSANVISIAEFNYDLNEDNGYFNKIIEFEIRNIEEV